MTIMSAREANMLALMSAAGVAADEASAKLDTRVRISHYTRPNEERLAQYLSSLLERTLVVVVDGPADIYVEVGRNYAHAAAQATLFVHVGPAAVEARDGVWPGLEAGASGDAPDLLLRIAACYLAGLVISRCVKGPRFQNVPIPFVISAQQLGLDLAAARRPIRFNGDVLIGAGGVANGFLWALEGLDVSGQLHIVDPKTVAFSNLNRCPFFKSGEVGLPKAEVLARNASPRFANLTLMPFVSDFRKFNREAGRVERVFTTVDSRSARRLIRNELPLAVIDASTTDLSEFVVFSERQPTARACLSCIYRHVPEESHLERHVAEGLGISVEQARLPFITLDLALELAAKHPSLEAAEIVGFALSSVYRQVCGAGNLMTSTGVQTLAPLGFISNLAGAMLCLELVRIEAAFPQLPPNNYLALDPWRPPYDQARRLRTRYPECEFCSDSNVRMAMQSVWPQADFSAS